MLAVSGSDALGGWPGSAIARGLSTFSTIGIGLPQPGHFAVLPRSFRGAVSRFWQLGHWTRIFSSDIDLNHLREEPTFESLSTKSFDA